MFYICTLCVCPSEYSGMNNRMCYGNVGVFVGDRFQGLDVRARTHNWSDKTKHPFRQVVWGGLSAVSKRSVDISAPLR